MKQYAVMVTKFAWETAVRRNLSPAAAFAAAVEFCDFALEWEDSFQDGLNKAAQATEE